MKCSDCNGIGKNPDLRVKATYTSNCLTCKGTGQKPPLDKTLTRSGKSFLGRYKGENFWITPPSWDCGWYWGFGYIGNPGWHTHVNSILWNKDDNGEYKYHFNEVLDDSVLTDKESWELADLFKSAYALRKVAEIYHTGNSHLTSVPSLDLKNKEMATFINEVELPKIFEAIANIIQPKQEKIK